MPVLSPPRGMRWLGVLVLAATRLAGGEPSFGDELAPRSTKAVQSAGCRRCCHTSAGDFSEGLSSGDLGECDQAFKGKPGMCVRGAGPHVNGDDALCCPSITAHFREGDEEAGDPGTCSFEPFSPCIRDTGGSCKYFSCSTLREAAQCVGDRCLCQPGYCSVDGICVNSCALNPGKSAGSISNVGHAPRASCEWTRRFLDIFGWKDWACSSLWNNYGRSECNPTDGFCYPVTNPSRSEDACWLGEATNGSIALFAYKCERDTGRAWPFRCSNTSVWNGCPSDSNSRCDESGRCMCGENHCSMAGVCKPIPQDHEALPVLPVGSSPLWSPQCAVILTLICCCCCLIVSKGDTLTLVAGEKTCVKIDMSAWEIIIDDLSERIVDVAIEKEQNLDVLVVTYNRKNGSGPVRVICKQSGNEGKWPQMSRMVKSFEDHGRP